VTEGLLALKNYTAVPKGLRNALDNMGAPDVAALYLDGMKEATEVKFVDLKLLKEALEEKKAEENLPENNGRENSGQQAAQRNGYRSNGSQNGECAHPRINNGSNGAQKPSLKEGLEHFHIVAELAGSPNG